MDLTSPIEEPKELRVTVDRVVYNADFEGPAERPHCFVYHISIHNGTKTRVTIKGRKWVVTNAAGEVTAVEGAGVVGQFPDLHPGDTFTYNSFHLLETETGAAEGSYLGIDENGHRVLTRIPRFEMKATAA
ncbi:MAG TPA: ApaG domain [Verrucomicrobiae bacterium]|nr:ApaG domain [Verrucomicrobiae bacterium]